MLFTGLRLSEAVALELDDVQVTARKGRVVVRSGKGDLQREVPLNPLVRQVLDEWLAERTAIAAPGERAVFLSRAGARLSLRAADAVVRKVAGMAGLELSAHVLRHTCLTGLVRRGTDLVTALAVGGYRRASDGCTGASFRTACRPACRRGSRR